MWMVRKDSIEKIRSIDFSAARDEGLANLDRVIADYPHPGELTPDEINTYLTHNIVFRVDEEMQKGLAHFFELAHKHQIIDRPKSPGFLEQ
jgi:chorismate dehydratase